jgi:N-acetylglucosamine-6-phosphate deacetylase
MATLTISSARLVTPSGIIEDGHLVIADSRIESVGEGAPPRASGGVIDARGRWLLPGLIDIHCHGGGGRSFQEPDAEAIRTVLAAHARGGTTSIVPAVAACPGEERHACLEALRAAQASTSASLPEILGAYVEGPYFSQKERGAQPSDLIGPPDAEDYLPTLGTYGDFIRVWSLAPELAGSADFICELRRRDIIAALGHSDASEEAVVAAVEAGAGLVTHIYCAQSTFHRVEAEKKLGVAEMGLLLDELAVEVISDGRHLPPRLLQLVLKNKPPDQVCLITDAMPAAGMPPGEYAFLGDTVWVTEEVAYRADRQRYAGSVLTMAGALAVTAEHAAASMVDLAQMASLTPARLLGLADRKGSLEPEKYADVVLLDDDFGVRMTICRGAIAYEVP